MKQKIRLMAVLWPLCKLSTPKCFGTSSCSAIGNRLSVLFRKYKRKQPSGKQSRIFMCADPCQVPALPGLGLTMGLTVFFLLILNANLKAQDNITSLQIGDTIPEEVWNLPLQVVNHPDGRETMTLSDYKDKLIIIDFWATWCVPCIRSLHKLDTLQEQFEDDVLVIPTTYEDAEKAEALLDKQGLSLPTAVSETALKQYFPHRSVPHQVWIKNNEVRAIAHSEDATEANVNKMLENDGFSIHTKIEVLDYDKTNFLSTYAERVGSPILISSILTEHIEGIPANVGRTITDDATIVFYTNLPIIMMYQRTLKVPNNRIIVQSNHVDKYVYVVGNKHQRFSYQLRLPHNSPESFIKSRILDDLNFQFQLTVDSQVMDMDCYVISDGERRNHVMSSETNSITSSVTKRVYNLSKLTNALNGSVIWQPDHPLYINESNYSDSIMLASETLASIKSNPVDVQKELEVNGLTLKKEKRPIMMYIISERIVK